mmetsp:Transcript_22649/g.51371  ORF Transcript_22649/g.51371 Transcript_22649/m.51371 type:complete len:95 (+) Transcript_22649:47-331(+)
MGDLQDGQVLHCPLSQTSAMKHVGASESNYDGTVKANIRLANDTDFLVGDLLQRNLVHIQLFVRDSLFCSFPNRSLSKAAISPHYNENCFSRPG